MSKRFTAAWNACAGISTEDLESPGFSLVAFVDGKETGISRAAEAERLLERALDEWECEFADGNPTIMAIKAFLDRGDKP